MKRILIFCLVTFGFCALANTLDDKGRFISFQGDISGNAGFFGAGLGYGQNIVIQPGYLGFFEINMRFHYNQLSYNRDVKMTYFTELNYGYEFMRHSLFSFGLDTFHGLGLTYQGKLAFSNGIGIFGKIKKDSLAFSIGYGIGHRNPFNLIEIERFDHYWRLKLQYYL